MRTILLLAAAWITVGCSKVTLDIRRGTATVRSFAVTRKIKAIEIRQGTNSFRIEGFESDQVEAIRAGIEAGTAAAMKAMKP